MSVCIIHTDIIFVYINSYMGRLRFTLTNIMFWIVLVLSCFLSENFALFTDAPRSGFESFPLYFLTFAIIGLLVLYYITEHKKNGLTLDKILLPCFIMMGALMIWTIFRQDNRTFTNWANDGTFEISFTLSERILAALQVVIWLGLLYAIVFVYNRYRLNLESYRWIAKIYIILVLLFCFIDLFYEWDIIAGIFAGTYVGSGVEFVFGNSNVWALVIFSGILTGLILSYKRFSWYYFSTMIAMFLYMILTTSATAIYIALLVMFLYPAYEVYLSIKANKRRGLTILIAYVSSWLVIIGLVALFINIGVPIFANFWKFVDTSLLHKDFLTITGRTDIWTHIIDLLKQNPLDFIFGLGHQTGSKIFQTYNAGTYPVKSAHNGVMEVFLRYGLLGVIVYGAMLLSVFFCLGIHVKHKRYRFVIIYGLAYLALLSHSVTESTNFFTPNIGGVYFGMYFILPIINVIQTKKFKEIKEDVQSSPVSKEKVPASFFFLAFIYVVAAILIAKVIYNFLAIDLFSCLLIVILLVMIGLFVLVLTNNKTINIINSNILASYLRRLEVTRNEK